MYVSGSVSVCVPTFVSVVETNFHVIIMTLGNVYNWPLNFHLVESVSLTGQWLAELNVNLETCVETSQT